MNTDETALHAEMLRRRNAHQQALSRAGYKVYVDPIAEHCLRVETGIAGTTIDVWVADLRDPQEESEITYTTAAGTSREQITEVAQIRDHFVSVLVDGLVRFLKGR